MPLIPNTLSMAAPGTWDAFNRITTYISQAERNAGEILRRMAENPGAHRQHAEEAVNLRNRLLEAVRGRSTPFGRAFSEALKEEGKTYAELLDMYAQRVRAGPAQLITPRDRFRAAVHAVARPANVPRPLEERDGFWGGARVTYLCEIMRAAATKVSPAISEHIIRASGRTNLLVNRMAYMQAGLGIAALMVGGSIVIAAFAGDQHISEEVLNALSITNWETGVRAGVNTLAALGTGTVARKIGSSMVVRNLDVRGRIGTVVILHVGMIFLLMWLLNMGFDQLF